MTPVTIDNLDIKNHVRWAHDQNDLDPSYIQEAPKVASHPELLGSSIIYASQWDLLFEWQKRNRPFAHFEPPHKYRLASRRLFSFRILPHMDWKSSVLSAEDLNDEDIEVMTDFLKKIIDLPCFENHPPGLFEREKTSILALLKSIQFLNMLLEKISALKLKYQKG